MTCGGCAGRVTRTLESVEGASDIYVNLADQSARFTVEDAGPMNAAVEALNTAGYPARSEQLRLAITGMTCASCVGRLDRAFRSEPGVIDAKVNLADETATVEYVPGISSPQLLIHVVEDSGYQARVISAGNDADHDTARAAEAEKHRRDLIVAAVLTVPVFLLEMGGHIFPAWHHLIMNSIGMQASWIIQFVLTTLVLIGPGRHFFIKGFAALRRRAPTMDSLVALGAGSAWVFSTVALFAPGLLPEGTRAVYFEAAAVIVTLILLGRWFEARAKGQTGTAIRKLMGLQPRVVQLRDGDGWREAPLDDLRVGDHFLLQPGARVPTDARVISGTSPVDESMITGEPMQVAKGEGDRLTGGSVNGNGSLVCEADRVGADTTLSQIIRMVQDAQGARLPIQGLVDKVTLWFVPGVIAIAALTVLAWLVFGPEPALSHALVAGVSVLIIACPCAMGLATPTSIMVGTGRAAELGVLFRQGDALQALDGIKVVALDKTGTLTEGAPALTTFEVTGDLDRDATLARIAAVESLSEHPVAQAVVQAAQEAGLTLPVPSRFEMEPGHGVTAEVDGLSLAIGNRALMTAQGVDVTEAAQQVQELSAKGQTVFYAAQDGKLAAVLAVSDPIRPTSAEAVRALKARGLKVAMITGDAEATAQAVASQIGIDTVVAGVLPEGKMEVLKELRAKHGKVAFVGDGINDAPVLAEADVGIAIGTGTDVAIETADVVLMSGDLRGVIRAFVLSRQTLRNIKENLVWAFGYNTLLIPVAAGALFPAFGLQLSPGLAAGAMAFSSVFVVGNALRLRRAGGVA